MTDGPFKNSELSKRWKRFANSLVNDAASLQERIGLACDSLAHDAATKDICGLLRLLTEHTKRAQMDLDPVPSMEAIFNANPKSPLTDTLQRHMTFNLLSQVPPEVALERALETSIRELVGEARNRMEEECIHVHDAGSMSRHQFERAIVRNRATFNAVDPTSICDALRAANKHAFKPAVNKKEGLDEGPGI